MSTGNVNRHIIEPIIPFESPLDFVTRMPVLPEAADLIARSRKEILDIVTGKNARLMVVVGPCSMDDEQSGAEYASLLARLAKKISDHILVVMRVYFEKPRTTIGWEGGIVDPDHDETTFDLVKGMDQARRIFLNVLNLGLPTATEFFDQTIPQYFGDVVSCAAVGARSVKAQISRRVASGLSPIMVYKNDTEGDVQAAVNAIIAASKRHAFLGIGDDGRVGIVRTTGNPDGYIMLRGGCEPNYTKEYIDDAVQRLLNAGLPPYLGVDCSHGNSGKDYRKQRIPFFNVLGQRQRGNKSIVVIGLESNLLEGCDPSGRYGISRTDACIGFEETSELLMRAYRSELERSVLSF